MPLFQNFCSGANRERSATIDAEATVNLFVSAVASDANAKRTFLTGTPGLRAFTEAATLGGRGNFSLDGRTWAVVGNQLYEILGSVATARGTIANDGLPVSFACNGRGGEQLAISGGGFLYILDLRTNVLTGPIVVPATNPVGHVDYIDGFFLLLERDTVRIWYSALEDGASWDALDFFARALSADNFIGFRTVRNRVWTFGSQTSEIFYDTGDALTPFVPYPGSRSNYGAISDTCIGVQGDSILWITQHKTVVRAYDGAPQELSTPAVAFAFASYSTITDAEALVYEQEGHAFVVWTFPTADVSWAIDTTTQSWHQRDSWNATTGTSHHWRARGVCLTASGLLVGDWTTGALSYLDLDTFTELGAMIRRVRRAPYPSAELQWAFIDQAELGIESGVGLTTGQGSDPKILAAISRDGGRTWTNRIPSTFGKLGEYSARCFWTRLGRVRLDRFVFEASSTEPVFQVWGPGLWLRVTQGTGQS